MSDRNPILWQASFDLVAEDRIALAAQRKSTP
jgi:hypothetical protein